MPASRRAHGSGAGRTGLRWDEGGGARLLVEEKGVAIWLDDAESKVKALGSIWIGRIPRAKGVGRVAAGGMGWMGHGEDF